MTANTREGQTMTKLYHPDQIVKNVSGISHACNSGQHAQCPREYESGSGSRVSLWTCMCSCHCTLHGQEG